MKKIKILCVILILLNSIILLLYNKNEVNENVKIAISGKEMIQAKADKKNSTNYKPEFYGTVEINVNVDDPVNLKSGMYRILANDYEDGNLTWFIGMAGENIDIDNQYNVDTSKEGSYIIKYSVVDYDNNEVVKEVPINITKDGKRTIKRKIYDFTNFADILDEQDEKGFTRGNLQDKQNLGIYLPAGASTKVWAVNELEEKLEIQYLSDNILKESESFSKKGATPLYGEDEFKKLSLFIGDTNTRIFNYNQKYTIQNKVSVYKTGNSVEPLEKYYGKSYSCVPFVKTPRRNGATTLEIEINDEIKSLDYYTYFDKYNPDMENDFAVIEGERITILLPKCNYKDIENSTKENGFKTLNELLQYYDNVITTFDEWVGLSKKAEKNSDKKVDTKFFVKPDQNAIERAEYKANYWISTHATDISDFLNEKYDWLPLHEIGHGYQGLLSEKSTLYLGEVSNNFLAYMYQRENGVNNWLNSLDSYDTKIMNEIDKSNKSYLLSEDWEELPDLFNKNGEIKDKFPIALFAYVNLLNKTGYIETIQNLYKVYRNKKDVGTNLNFICTQLSDFSKLNVVPYFERWKVYPHKVEKIWDKDYPIPYYIRDLVSNDEQASAIVEDLKQEGLYSTATPDELQKYNLKGNIEIIITEEILDKLNGDSLIIKNGNKEVAKVILDNKKNYMIENISIGAYEMEIKSEKDITQKNKYILVKENEKTKIELNSDTISDKLNDITGDGILDINDITAIKRHISAQTTGKNKAKWILPEEMQLVADVTGDEVIDVNDIVKIKRYIAATSDETVAQKKPQWLIL